MHLVWREALRTGLRDIDLQHRELIEIINDLEDACGGTGEIASIDAILARLSAYAVFHFETEEALMRTQLPAASAHAEAHLQAHGDFAARLQAFRVLGEAARVQRSAALHDFLKTWFVDHVMGTDKALARLPGSGSDANNDAGR